MNVAGDVKGVENLNSSLAESSKIKQRDILFDGGSANFVVTEIPSVQNIDNVAKQIQEKSIEAAAKVNLNVTPQVANKIELEQSKIHSFIFTFIVPNQYLNTLLNPILFLFSQQLDTADAARLYANFLAGTAQDESEQALHQAIRILRSLLRR